MVNGLISCSVDTFHYLSNPPPSLFHFSSLMLGRGVEINNSIIVYIYVYIYKWYFRTTHYYYIIIYSFVP